MPERVPGTMTAAVLTRHGGPEALQVQEVPVPRPGTGQVLVEVAAAALNNTDLWTREGGYGLPGDPDTKAGWRGPVEFPRIQGGDIAGEVSRLGEGVPDDLAGRRVLVDPALYEGPGADALPVGLLGSERDGGFARFVVVDANRAHPVDDSPLDVVELACLPVAYGTAMGMLERGRVAAGDTVLVTGASGGVGLALVQLAAARGARVVAVSSGTKVPQVRDAGAATVVDRDAEGSLADSVHGVLGAPLDVVLDVVAGPEVAGLLPLLRDGGRWVVAGALGGHTVELDLRRLYLRNIALVGSSMHTPAHFALLVDAARNGDVRPVVAARYPITAIHDAQAALGRRTHVGKLVIDLRAR